MNLHPFDRRSKLMPVRSAGKSEGDSRCKSAIDRSYGNEFAKIYISEPLRVIGLFAL
ncbi:MAG: hypothetical protein ACKVHR_14730 [Pirellulales bacterium]|jgi:hypothetical protein